MPLESPVCSLQRNRLALIANIRSRDREAHLPDLVHDLARATSRDQSCAVLKEVARVRNREADEAASRRVLFAGEERLGVQAMTGEAEGNLDVAQVILREVQVTVYDEKVNVTVVEVKLGDAEVMKHDVVVKSCGVVVMECDAEVNEHAAEVKDPSAGVTEPAVEKEANAEVSNGAEAKEANVEENDEAATTSDWESEAATKVKADAKVTPDDVEAI